MARDREYLQKLIKISLEAAETSEGSIRDLFLNQAARIEQELAALPKVPKKGAGRRLAARLKKLGRRKPPKSLVKKLNRRVA